MLGTVSSCVVSCKVWGMVCVSVWVLALVYEVLGTVSSCVVSCKVWGMACVSVWVLVLVWLNRHLLHATS